MTTALEMTDESDTALHYNNVNLFVLNDRLIILYGLETLKNGALYNLPETLIV